jgi:FkbM family methyltransferase
MTISYRKDTDDDRWVIPEVMDQDMYCVKSRLAALEPARSNYVIDCGAHIGAFSMMCAQHLKHSEIISFEPNPDSFKHLDENSKQFGRIRPMNKAVALTNGELNLYAPDQSDWSGRWTTLPNNNAFLTVEAVDLFAFINQLDEEVFILKMDIEGYEEQLMEAAREADIRKVKVFIIETHTDHFNHQKLLDCGYQLLYNPHISAARQFVYVRD